MQKLKKRFGNNSKILKHKQHFFVVEGTERDAKGGRILQGDSGHGELQRTAVLALGISCGTRWEMAVPRRSQWQGSGGPGWFDA